MKHILILAALALACHDLTPKQQAALNTFECEVHVLSRYVEPVLDAAQLARDLYTGKADLGTALGSLGMLQSEADMALEMLRACRGKPEPLVAPPPAPGNKVL